MSKGSNRSILSYYGINGNYRSRTTASGLVEIIARNKMTMADGVMHGTEILLTSPYITIWTSKVRIAKELHRKHGASTRLRLLNGEAILYVSYDTADAVLPSFARVYK